MLYHKKVKKSACPVCKEELDGATNIGGKDIKPQSGDYCICVFCTAYLKYNNQLDLVLISEEELLEKPFLMYELSEIKNRINQAKNGTQTDFSSLMS